MKTKYIAILASLAATGLGMAQTAYTDPVGYVTVPIPAGGTTGSPKLQLAAQQLLPSGATQFAGTADSFGSDGGGTFLQDAAGTWTAGSYINSTETPALLTHLVEILDGPLTGTLTWITSTAANKIYTFDNIAAAGAGAKFRVLKAFTIAGLFNDVAPLSTALGGGTSIVAADNLLLFNSSTNTYTTFWYKNGGVGGTGWRSNGTSSTTIPGKTAIHPSDSGLVIQRKQDSAGSIVIPGDVKTGDTDVVVKGGVGTKLNILSPSIPVDQIKLGTSTLYTGSNITGLNGGTSIVAADNVLIFNASTNAYTTFWYKNGGVGGTGWRSNDAGILDPANYLLPSTSAILIQRKGGVDFTWQIPAVQIGN